MSLVGTRPILPDELEQYELHHRARIAIKPGITGMWQVSGRSDITDFEEIVRLDTEYISEKKALIVANLVGFASFLVHDMQIPIEKGYTVTFAANANKLEWSDTKEKLDDLGGALFK